MGEDAQQTRDRTAARNLALLRKVTLNLAQQALQPGSKRLSLKNVRNLAAWDLAYRNRLLGLARGGSSCGGPDHVLGREVDIDLLGYVRRNKQPQMTRRLLGA